MESPSTRASRPHISKKLRQQIAVQANHRCEYCQTAQEFTAMPMEIEHIIPHTLGGASTFQNLCLACALCNGYKGVQTHAIDPVAHERVNLFHPREQKWYEHFIWNDTGIEIVGRTAIGRATVSALKVNNEHITRARFRWVLAGWHPPT